MSAHPLASTTTRRRWLLPAILAIATAMLAGAGAEAGTTQSNNQSSGAQSTQQSATTAYGTRPANPPVGGAGAQQNATSTQALKEKFDAAARQPSTRSGPSGTSGNADSAALQEQTRARAGATAEGSAQGAAAKVAPSRESLSRAAEAPDRNGFTRAGRALQKHSNRAKTKWRQDDINTNIPAAANARGKALVNNILTAPGTRIVENRHGGFDAVAEDGRVVRFKSDGSMDGFRE